MKKIYLFVIMTLPLHLYGQIDGIVVDKETNKPIPFANIWVENIDVGTSSDNEGNFHLIDSVINRNLIVSSVGYETQKIAIKNSPIAILLQPKIYELKEVIINPKNFHKAEIGTFKKSKIISFYNSGGKPWIAARYFNFETTYKETPFIKSVDLLTKSENDSSIFRLRIMSVAENGEPLDDLITKQIFVNVKKGTNINSIDLSEHQLKFPDKGFFVAVEWLDIEKNRFEIEQIDNKSGEKCKKRMYNPSIGNIIEDDYKNGWIYVYGSWRKPYQIKNKIKNYYGKYRNIAVKLTLTD